MASVAVANTTGTAAAQSMSNAMHVDGPSTADAMPAVGITRTRANVKGKHLMRSQALRESASPPRAPIDTGPPVVVIAHDEPPTGGASPTNASGSSASTAAPPPPFFTSPKSTLSSSSSPPTIHSASPTNVAGCDLTTPAFLDQEFPKLAQPKSKGTRGGHNGTSPPFKTSPVNGAAEIKKPHLLEVTPITSGPNKVPLLPRSCSSDKDYGHCCTTAGTDCSSSDNCAGCSAEEMPTRMTGERSKKNRNMAGGGAGGGGGGGGGGLFVKGSKPRLKSLGSSASADEVISSGFISRDDSFEQYTDSNGVDLLQFFKETLNKNTKDRNTLIRIEKDLMALALDRSRSTVKFPPMSSYNRMLIHRVSAYFGMEHNVDATQQCVIAGITKATRVPEVRFRSLIRDDEPRKSILKRESQSFDEYRRGMLRGGGGPGDYRGGLLDRKAKSFEEREEEYERVKLRIFKKREAAAVAAAAESAENGGAIAGGGGGDQYWPSWGGSDSSEHDGMQAMRGGHKSSKGNRLLKVQSLSVETKPEGRPPISKSHSFGGYGPASAVHKSHPHGSRLFSKQDSLTTSWRLSPSSSGYKTQTQSIRSDSVTPSPTGYESGGDQTPEPSHTGEQPTACGVVWAVTDMAAVPPGSVLIDPQTLQPIINQDGSIYHFDPDNLPVPCHARKPHNKQPIVDEADETAAAGCGDECIDGDDDLTCRDSQCNEDAPPPLLGNYPAELYEPLPVDMHSQQQQQICHQSVVDAANNIQNFDLSCELTTIEHETGELSITNKAEMHVENLSIIPEDGQPLAEIESPLEYVNAAEGTLMQYPPPPYQSEANIPKAAGGIQYFTYPSTDVELGPGTYLVPVYDPPADVAALSGHHPHQQHSSPQTNQPHGQTGVGGTTAVYTSPSANMAPAILPLAYPPTMFHGAATAHHPHHMAPTASAQLVYAAAPLDATGAPMAGGQSAPQYFTIPMGYPYACNDPAYASYWPNPMTYYVPQAVATPNTDSATSATFHPNSSYPMHPHLVSTTATTAYTTAYTAKRGSPNAQQAQQQHQQQQSHHHQHHHAAIAASAVHQHHSPYATATTFNASLSFAPNQTGVVPYVTAAAAAATAAAASGDAGALMKGLYPIPQPIYTNFVHQAYQQQQQQQHHHQSHHQQSQPHQQQQQQQQLLPRPTAPGPSASSVQNTVATTTTATSTAVLPAPPSLSNSCSPPQTALSSSANSSPTLSSPSPPTSTNTVTTVLSPTSAAAASFQPINPPYELTATYGKPPASARYHQHHLHNNHHHHHSVDRASSSYGSESYSPPTATTGSGLYRKPHSFYNNGYAQHSGSSAGIMYTPGGSGRQRPQPSTGAEHYATAAYVSQAHHHHSQQPSHHHHSQQPSHHHQHHHHGSSSTGAPYHNGSNGAAAAAGTSSFTYHKNQFKFHMQKRSATIDSMSAPITPTTSQPSAHYFQAGGATSGGGGTTGGSNTSFRTHPSHGAGAGGGHHHLQLAPLMAFHGGSSAEHKYRPTGPRGPKSTYLGNKYVPPGGQQTTATVATVTHSAAQQPSTSRSSPHSSVHSTESANGSAGATGGGSSVLSLPLCDSPPQHSAAAAVAGQAATAVAPASSRMYVGTMAGEAGLTSTVSSGPLVPTCYGSTTSSSSSAAVAAAAAMAAGYAAGPSTGMYVKLGQAFFAHHPSLSFANHHHHRTKIYTAKDVRPQIGHHLSEILPSMNMMLTTPRLMNPRSSNHNMTGRTPRPR